MKVLSSRPACIRNMKYDPFAVDVIATAATVVIAANMCRYVKKKYVNRFSRVVLVL